MSVSKEYALSASPCICSFGTAPSVINALSQQKMFVDGRLVLTEMDLLIPPFAMCNAKPPIPVPCTPALTKWIPTAMPETVTGFKPLLKTSSIMCSQGGKITITG